MTRRPAALILALSLVCVSCGAPLLKLPSGPGASAPDGPQAMQDATAACRRVASLTLEISVAGSVAGRRVRGRLLAGLARADSIRLEAVAPFGQPVFILTSEGAEATLLLPRDNRVLEHGRPDAVLEAVTGVPLEAPALFTIVTGCSTSPPSDSARAYGEDWRVMAAGPDEVYLNREKAGPWRVAAMERRPGGNGWRAEYRNFTDGLARAIRLVSTSRGAFDLQLGLSQVELNPALGREVFRVEIPASATSITLDELKASGPLGTNGR